MSLRKLLLALSLIAAPVVAQTVPQWSFSTQNGQSTAAYQGNVLVLGNLTQQGPPATSASQLFNSRSASQNVTGAATLGQPATGYQWNFNAATDFSTITSTSGWNQSLSTNDGRTALANYVGIMQNLGNGDAGIYYGNCHVFGTGNPGATHWLAEPACIILNGDLATTLAHSYLNQFEFNLNDNGNDVAAIADVENFHRTVNTHGFGEVWMGDRWQSVGSKAIDVGWSAQGLVNVGVDTVQATGDAAWNSGNTVALNMAANQRIEFNSTATPLNGISYYGNNLGNSYDVYASSILSRCNGSACINLSTTAAALTVPVQLPKSTVSALPTCNSALEGALAAVTDANSTTFNAALAGSGANHVMAYCNGSGWTVH